MVSRICPTNILSRAILPGLAVLTGVRGHGGHVNDAAASATPPTAVMSRPVLQVPSPSSSAMSTADMSYLVYPQHASWMYAHIALMVAAWVFVLPPGLALSIARSRLALPVEATFLGLNALGIATAAIYNGRTPDLYPHNVHHGLGWLLTVVVLCRALVGVVGLYRGPPKRAETDERAAFIPVSTNAMAEHHRVYGAGLSNDQRFSRDSGHGTERVSSSFRSNVSPSRQERIDRPLDEIMARDSDDEVGAWAYDSLEHEKRPPHKRPWDAYLSRVVRQLVSDRTYRIVERVYDATDRLLLLLAFVGLASGVVAYSGIFHANDIYNGMAHFVKGGIFVWYGLLTLGRWMGCFADFGWAWNVKPSKSLVGRVRAAVPSAEFVESLVIFTYGATNVFMEHLAAWGEAWTAQDLEHVSISVMFFGGGLCGMLVESKRVRDLLNAPITSTVVMTPMTMTTSPHQTQSDPPDTSIDPPRTYRFSMNPLPALIIMLLGLMMSSHHQSSAVATMVHKQWGVLFVSFSLARAVTYLTMYLSPPTSILPSRPPSELVSSFCLIAGGLIFMASNRDTVKAMERTSLEAMFLFTVTMGLTALIMAWTILVVAIKGWALRRRSSRVHMTVTMIPPQPIKTSGCSFLFKVTNMARGACVCLVLAWFCCSYVLGWGMSVGGREEKRREEEKRAGEEKKGEEKRRREEWME